MLRILLRLEGTVTSLIAGYLLLLILTKHPENLPAALFEVFFALLSALVLFSAVRFIFLRSAAILLNIIALPVSRTLIQSERWFIAVPLAVVAVATLIALFVDRKTLAELRERSSE